MSENSLSEFKMANDAYNKRFPEMRTQAGKENQRITISLKYFLIKLKKFQSIPSL